MTLLDDRPIPGGLKSAQPISRMSDQPCVCTPSRATWWRYPMPGRTGETVGMYVLLSVLLLLDTVLYWLLAFGS